MATSHRQAWEELARCINQLILTEPFFGHLLGSVIRDVTPSTPTMAVGVQGAKLVLQVNPEFLMQLKFSRDPSRCERTGVIKHETLHLVFKHIFRRETRQPQLYNLAADLVVNQFIAPWIITPEGITLDTFPDLNLEPNQSLDWYYNRLMDAKNDPSIAPESARRIEQMMGEGCPSCGDHALWGKEHDVDAQVADSILDRLIVQAKDRAGARGWDPLPNHIKELINAAVERRRPKLDWRRVVRIFAASSRKTRVQNTMRRQSKRYGTFPGIRVNRFQRLAVAVDTSGSISDHDLSDFFGEIHGIWRQGADVTIIECDATVRRTYPYTGTLPQKVGGRGGTAFDPVFEWLRSNRMIRYDGCIYLTDGYADAPSIQPPCKLLWVVTGDGSMGEHLRFGRAIQLPPQ